MCNLKKASHNFNLIHLVTKLIWHFNEIRISIMWFTSGSASWENLERVSRIFSWGFETEIRPKARGTARRITGSQYLKGNCHYAVYCNSMVQFIIQFRGMYSVRLTLTNDQNGERAFHFQCLHPLQPGPSRVLQQLVELIGPLIQLLPLLLLPL